MVPLEPILKSKYPAKAHARRVAAYINSNGHSTSHGLIYLEAQKTRFLEDNDQEIQFRQRRPFFYLSGCDLPDCYLTYSVPDDRLTLFLPPIDPDAVVWTGLPTSASEAKELYDVDDVQSASELNASLAHSASFIRTTTPGGAHARPTVFAIAEQVSTHVTFLPFHTTNFDILKKAIENTRVVKDDYEIALILHANRISALAHTAVLQNVKHAANERQLAAIFYSTCIKNGAPEQAYHPIVAGGTDAATLHYTKNDKPLDGTKTLNLLLDAGGEYSCYCADITRTFPVSGSFTTESRQIYDIVLSMQLSCLKLLKTGVRWEDVHEHAHKIAIQGLLDLGILKGTPKELFEKRVSVAFYPHGLGHYLGMDTHDTGGNADPNEKDPMFRYLRVRGALPAGAVITVEPGVYFCRFLIEPFLKDPDLGRYIDEAVLEKYWEVGGVRIEDNVVITDSGYDNLTTAIKDVKEMEKIINGV